VRIAARRLERDHHLARRFAAFEPRESGRERTRVGGGKPIGQAPTSPVLFATTGERRAEIEDHTAPTEREDHARRLPCELAQTSFAAALCGHGAARAARSLSPAPRFDPV
jgi:hypothetical protein